MKLIVNVLQEDFIKMYNSSDVERIIEGLSPLKNGSLGSMSFLDNLNMYFDSGLSKIINTKYFENKLNELLNLDNLERKMGKNIKYFLVLDSYFKFEKNKILVLIQVIDEKAVKKSNIRYQNNYDSYYILENRINDLENGYYDDLLTNPSDIASAMFEEPNYKWVNQLSILAEDESNSIIPLGFKALLKSGHLDLTESVSDICNTLVGVLVELPSEKEAIPVNINGIDKNIDINVNVEKIKGISASNFIDSDYEGDNSYSYGLKTIITNKDYEEIPVKIENEYVSVKIEED